MVPDSLRNVSNYLKENQIQILTGDYKQAVATADTGDFVYFDPPYVPINITSNFTTYTKQGFGMVQQEQLRDLAKQLSQRGVKVMLSNSDTPTTRKIYDDPIFKLHEVQAMRYVNSKASGRGKVGELIITTS